MLGDKMPCCFVDGVTYGAPWFSESVEKPASGKLDVEDKKWWLDARQLYADQLSKLLIQSEVKNIDPSNYSISYRYDVNVPRQGKFTGDCRIWVMQNLYTLLNNLPLEVSNPTQAGLAYREHLTDFFW
ncbi:hypothetical protein Tco_1251511 [Tanacetum coccineum]